MKIFFFGLVHLVFATTFVSRPFEERVGLTPFVVQGRVLRSYSDWGDEGHQRKIFTFHQLEVIEVLKGSVNSNEMILRTLGGEKDGVGMKVPGAAQFSQGEEVVVFLGEKQPDDSYPLFALSRGKYDIVERSGKQVLEGPGIDSEHDHAETEVHSDTDSSKKEWTINRLKKLILEQKKETSEQKPRNQSSFSESPHEIKKPNVSAPSLQISKEESVRVASEQPESSSSLLNIKVWILLLILGGLVFVKFIKRS
ncbi:MAG: hypothetical protein CL678_06965 [Bdellovibrionaceae bacterium]|nr:hypothetical protein [Pseudobdellovibrionaceae bacterium]|tara:strand:- start:85 stop:843 length:759 start_codon:yes stop_codon:yes gene_type:complete